jgi:hypothetical protein
VSSCVRVAYTKKDTETSSGTGLLDSVSLLAPEHQPRLSALYHRIGHLRTHSLTCSSCGPLERSYWFCNHCHLSLCGPCWASWHYPEAATNLVGVASRTLLPSSSCLDFRPPLHRLPLSQTIVAGGLNDRSHLHIPVVVVSILGIPAANALPLSQSLEYTARDYANTAGYGCVNFRIATNTSGSLEKLKSHVRTICALVRDCYAGRFVLDLRSHAVQGKCEFSPHLFTTAEIFQHFILPITRAFRDAQRLTRGRYPAFDSTRAAVAASRILVLFHCCDTELVTFLQMLDEFLDRDGVAVELLLFQRPLLLKEMNVLMPSFMGHYTNALCPLSTFDILEQSTSASQRRDFVPTFLSPQPGSRHYYSRVLAGPSPSAASLANRLPRGGLSALSRRSDPFGAYAPPAVEPLGPSAASRSAPVPAHAPAPALLLGRAPLTLSLSASCPVFSSSAAAAAAAAAPSRKRPASPPPADHEQSLPEPRSAASAARAAPLCVLVPPLTRSRCFSPSPKRVRARPPTPATTTPGPATPPTPSSSPLALLLSAAHVAPPPLLLPAAVPVISVAPPPPPPFPEPPLVVLAAAPCPPLTATRRTQLLKAWLFGLSPDDRTWLVAQAQFPGRFRDVCNQQLPFLVQAAFDLPTPPLLPPASLLGASTRLDSLLALLRSPAL